MELLNSLTTSTQKPSRRVGRGIGSKKGGHTTGRGQKGDKSRGKSRITFDGTKIKKGWIKRTPFLRGKHRVEASTYDFPVNLGQIDAWYKANDTVDQTSLLKKLNSTKIKTVKILADGKLSKALVFKGLKFSQKAKDAIVAANGKIE